MTYDMIHEEEELIMRDWEAAAAVHGEQEGLVTDGLLLRGEIYYSGSFWHRKPGDEEERWNTAPRRLLILTKDLNDDEAWDIRQETGRYNTAAFSYSRAIPFYKNLRMWSYGLLNVTRDGCPPFSEASDMEKSGPFYENAPIARVNCKKQTGRGSIHNRELLMYLERYAPLLKRQIALYDADIILCCGSSGGRNVILDFVKSQYLVDLQQIPGTGNWIYYSPSCGKIAVNSYHPSARIGYEDTYTDMMHAMTCALEYINAHFEVKPSTR